MARKLTVLCNTEASYLGTGYGVYSYELLSRLHASQKYNLIELASFGEPHNPMNRSVPWTFIPVMPDRNNPAEVNAFNSEQSNVYGKWKFEATLAKCKVDVVLSFRDSWMSRFENLSPYRRYYRLIQMPTVDGEPQMDEWLALFANTDKLFTYTDWGFNLLLKEGKGSINLVDSASPAADYNIFRPLNGVRQKHNLSSDIFIIGMIGRNQARKLIPNLISDFGELHKTLSEEHQKRTFLYLHTCWPDIGFSLPLLIKESGLGHRILVSYLCQNCRQWFPSVFSYGFRQCPHCNQLSARMPTPEKFLTREQLAEVCNIFDVYVQYACASGFEMPLVETAACGKHVLGLDYAAISDVVRKLNGDPIKVGTFTRDVHTHRKFAYPDTNDFVKKVKRLVESPKEIINNLGYKAAEAARKHYQWDETAQKWMNTIDNLEYPSHETTWGSQPQVHNPNVPIPPGLDNQTLVNWCLVNIANRPDLVGTYWAAAYSRDLMWQCKINNLGGMHFSEDSLVSVPRMEKYTHQDFFNDMINLCNEKNRWEAYRLQAK